jgi:hypothetical protein
VIQQLAHSSFVVSLLTMTLAALGDSTVDESTGQDGEVTIMGNVLCNRAMDSKPWNWDAADGDHTPVIFAFEGTPQIAEQVGTIMAGYPERGLDVDDAVRIQDELRKRVTYFVAASPIAAQIHKDVEAGSRLLALTGKLSEKNGQRWITVRSLAPARMKYPDKMLAPDRPFSRSGQDPLVLKIRDGLVLKCRFIPAGRFLQGSPFYQRRYQDEYPHEVVLTRPFYLSEIPVTQEMFQEVVGKNPSVDKAPRFPVTGAAYADIQEFCRVLSTRNGVRVRLPTDAEWEYAARVGTSNPCITEKYKDQISETGGRPSAAPIHTKQPNAWGLYDMLCGGWHFTNDYKADNVRVKQVDPRGPRASDPEVHRDSSGRLHKSRGGWHYDQIRPNMHGAVGENGTIWEGGSPIFRVAVESGTTLRETEQPEKSATSNQ